MPKFHQSKTNFTAGVIGSNLYGRSDLKAYVNGAAILDNMLLHATGGISRRNGSLHLHDYGQEKTAEQSRIIPFEFNSDQNYILCLRDFALDIFLDGKLHLTLEKTPFPASDLGGIRFTQSADMLLLVHPNHPPQKLVRRGEADWTIAPLAFYDKDNCLHQPYFKFAADGVTLKANKVSGTITLTASQNVFVSAHIGMHFKIANKEIIIKTVTNGKTATASTRQSLISTDATEDWAEPAFSSLHGYPNSVCFHQERLFFGGSRDLPNRIWGSKSIDFFNFDLGEGLDDESIEISLLADQVNIIEALFSGYELQIFTSGAEWTMEGNPLTPADLTLSRQTRSGTKGGTHVAPCYIEGGTIFASRGTAGNSTRTICEFIFTEADQAFLATDMGVLTDMLDSSPIDQAYDKLNRRLYAVLENGSLAVLTIFRSENVFGWTSQKTQGRYLSIAVLHDQIYMLVARDNGVALERMDRTLYQDGARSFHHETPIDQLQGLELFDNQCVQLVNDGRYIGDYRVKDGAIALPQALSGNFTVGLSYESHVAALPFAVEGNAAPAQLQRMRLVKAILRLQDSAYLEMDTGQGFHPLSFLTSDVHDLDQPPLKFSGDHSVRALGWNMQGLQPLWRLRSDRPLPMTILSLTNQVALYG
ncbi:MAG: hypothetical protein AB8B77_03595 [Alphaproteobacteria bacterium]